MPLFTGIAALPAVFPFRRASAADGEKSKK
jgi:hypothetical protein